MKNFPVLNILGLMSGTSMDGIDACLAQIQFKETTAGLALDKAEIIETQSIEYPKTISEKLHALVKHPQQCHLATVCELNFEISDAFASVVLEVKKKLPTRIQIDAIASHGQTVFHIPPNSTHQTTELTASTLQLGDISVIAQRTGIKTIGNFRTADMTVGGQGAPLVPFADQLLFQQTNNNRAVHNLGGISNCTILPSVESGDAIFAFDTGPANCLINMLTEKYYQVPYDRNGDIACSGIINTDLLNELLALDYFKQPPPKSTGRELFGQVFVEQYFYSGKYSELSPADKIATATALTTKSIQNAYRDYILPKVKITEIIFGGGGVQNNYLMSQLRTELKTLSINVKTHQDYGIANQYKEALAFALLGYANLVGVPANVPSCTGASKAVLLGQVASL